MEKNYVTVSRAFRISALVILFSLGILRTANASHALPIVGLTSVLGPTTFTISGSSDASTCVGTTNTDPYWMQVEITCDPNGFTGAPPVATSPLWGTAPWFHSDLNIPGPPWNDQCVQEAYHDIVIPLSQLCTGTTYYWRVREFCPPNSVAAWMGPFSFVTPGSPPASVLTATASQYTLCPGSTAQLSAVVSGGCPGGTYTYSWQPTTGLDNPNIQNPIVTAGSSTITYTVTAGGGCFTITSADDTVQITPGPPVAAGTTSATPASVCSGQSSLVVLTGMGSNTIQWQVSPNGTTWFNMSGQNDDTLNTGPLSSSLFYQAVVTGSGWPGSGCGTSVSTPVQVVVNAAPSANAGPNQTICNGSCANLTGTGGVSYDWQPVNMTGSNITVCPASTTNYTLTVTDANGCTATDNITVFTSTASVTASPDVNICTGNSTVLFASGPNGNTYNWTPNGTLTGSSTANPTATPPSTTTYTVTATNTSGCTAVDSVVVTVSPAPPITVSNDTSMCAGGSATLVASGATSYTWNPGNFTTSSITVSPNSTTTYTVTGNNSNCLSTDSVTVSINPPPYVFAGPDFSVCNGSQATMNVSTTGTSYLWTPTTGIIGSNSTQNVVIAPTSNTSYTVTVTGPGGCISTDTINVSVNAIPNVTASSPDNTICSGLSTTVNAGGATSYSWIPTTGLSSPTSGSSTANPSTTTTYQVIGTDANGCMDTASITITVNPLPGVYITSTPTECGDSTGTMINSGVVSGTGPFTFTINSVNYTTLPTNLMAGAYPVTTTDANGCVSTQTVTVGMVNTASVTAAANPTFGVYPLPVGFGASGSSGINNYFWQFGDPLGSNTYSQSPNFTYTGPGTYTVVLTAWNDWIGCAVTDTIVIEVVEEAIVNLPNVFTPNADGVNDGFSADITGVKDIKVEVFNRWGNSIYEAEQSGLPSTHQVLQLWDGQKGDDGVYYYVVNVKGYDDKDYTYTGFVHLLKGKP
jgi:gliding motility-associated-like protein